MEKEIILTKRFLKNADDLYNYILKEWSAKIAFEFLGKLETQVDKIGKNPSSGKPSATLAGVRSVQLKPHNRIYFREKPKSIRILAIIDMRIDPSKNPYK